MKKSASAEGAGFFYLRLSISLLPLHHSRWTNASIAHSLRHQDIYTVHILARIPYQITIHLVAFNNISCHIIHLNPIYLHCKLIVKIKHLPKVRFQKISFRWYKPLKIEPYSQPFLKIKTKAIQRKIFFLK